MASWAQERQAKIEQIEHIIHDLTTLQGLALCTQSILSAAAERAEKSERARKLLEFRDRLTPAVEIVAGVIDDFQDEFALPKEAVKVP